MDKEWSLSVLDTFHEYYDNFVAAGKINPGTVWVLKASKAAEKINRSVVSLADVFQMDKNTADFFWKPFGKLYANQLESHFGDRACIRRCQGVWTIIVKTAGMDPALLSTDAKRVATVETIKNLQFTCQ
jgi:hypothetical protein